MGGPRPAQARCGLPDPVHVRGGGTAKSETGELFYRLLFEIDPASRELFSATDMRAQGEMLMTMLAAVMLAGAEKPAA